MVGFMLEAAREHTLSVDLNGAPGDVKTPKLHLVGAWEGEAEPRDRQAALLVISLQAAAVTILVAQALQGRRRFRPAARTGIR